MSRIVALIICSFSLITALSATDDGDWIHAHTLYGQVLSEHVRDGRVNYQALKEYPELLELYLKRISSLTAEEFESYTEQQQLSLLLNLYNAATIQLVTQHYSISSIRRIGGWFSGPFSQKFISFQGEMISLDGLENDIIRRRYDEPLVHFALVCASTSCPSLRGEPYVADKLHEQLEDQARQFLRDMKKNRFDHEKRIAHLSKIFKWYSEDFVWERKGVIAFVQRYVDDEEREHLETGRYRIVYLPYDWSLNDWKP